jgi:hypothetical protein
MQRASRGGQAPPVQADRLPPEVMTAGCGIRCSQTRPLGGRQEGRVGRCFGLAALDGIFHGALQRPKRRQGAG